MYWRLDCNCLHYGTITVLFSSLSEKDTYKLVKEMSKNHIFHFSFQFFFHLNNFENLGLYQKYSSYIPCKMGLTCQACLSFLVVKQIILSVKPSFSFLPKLLNRFFWSLHESKKIKIKNSTYKFTIFDPLNASPQPPTRKINNERNIGGGRENYLCGNS